MGGFIKMYQMTGTYTLAFPHGPICSGLKGSSDQEALGGVVLKGLRFVKVFKGSSI